MNDRQFAAALAKLGITKVALARALQINERTVRNWGKRSAVPNIAIALLNLLKDTGKTIEDLRV